MATVASSTAEPASVRVVVVVSDPSSLQENVLIVQSDLLAWGSAGWTATLLRHDDGHTFEGVWGANYPTFEPCPVPPGDYRMVLSLSNAEENWVGWVANLHENARMPETIVTCLPGRETLVKLWLTLGQPPSYLDAVISETPPDVVPPHSPHTSPPVPPLLDSPTVATATTAPAGSAFALSNATTHTTSISAACDTSCTDIESLSQLVWGLKLSLEEPRAAGGGSSNSPISTIRSSRLLLGLPSDVLTEIMVELPVNDVCKVCFDRFHTTLRSVCTAIRRLLPTQS